MNEERGRLKCERCGRGFDVEGQRVSHIRSCMGGAYWGGGIYEAARGMYEVG